MPDGDLMKLYSQRILALTAAIPHLGRLDAPGGTGRVRAPLCGSVVTVDVTLDAQGRVTAFAQDVKACALGQAAASVVGGAVPGLDAAAIRQGRRDLAAMLAGGPPPKAPFEELESLRPAQEYANRHASILLVFDATLAAIEDATVEAKAAG